MRKNSTTEFYSIRPFYVFGFGQEKNSLINQLFKASITNQNINLSSCNVFRDYIYVYNVVYAFLNIINSNFKNPGIYNVGSGKSIKLKTFVKKIWSRLDKDNKMLKFDRLENKKEQAQLKSFSNNSKIKKYYNWKIKYKLDDGINHMVKEFNLNK